MHNKIFRSVPIALTTSAANILSPFTAASSGVGAGANTYYEIYMLIKHISIVNRTQNAVTFSMWLGATGASAANTEVIGSALSIAANDRHDWYSPGFRVEDDQFLTGLASANSALTVLITGEIGVY